MWSRCYENLEGRFLSCRIHVLWTCRKNAKPLRHWSNNCNRNGQGIWIEFWPHSIQSHNCSKPLVPYNYRSWDWDWDWDWGGRVCVGCNWIADWKCDVAGGSSVGNLFSHRHGNTWFVVELLLRPTVGQHGWVTWQLWPATCISILPMLFSVTESRMLPSRNYIKQSYYNEFSRL